MPADRPFAGRLIAFEGPQGDGHAETLELARAIHGREVTFSVRLSAGLGVGS